MTYFTIVGIVCGLLTSFILLGFPNSRKSPNWFLGLAVLGLTHSLLMSLLNLNGSALEYPHLIRTGNLSVYLLFPFLYLFYKGVFKSESRWKNHYFLLFIPAFIYLIDFLPFFLLSADEKIALFSPKIGDTSALFSVDEGMFKLKNFHLIFRTVSSSFFLLLIGKILYDFKDDFKISNSKVDFSLFKKLGILWLILIILLMVPAVMNLIITTKSYTVSFLIITLSLTLILITLNLLAYPRLLYGFYWEFEVVPQEAGLQNKNEEESADEFKNSLEEERIFKELTAYFSNHKSFLMAGYSIHKMASDVNIPAYRISYVINKIKNQNFSAWINSFRIDHFISLVENGAAEKYTLDSIAQDCGFRSRTTLINSFKKEKGITPGAFIKEMQAKNPIN
ncbi:helix-turn-helix domain-containing protein [Algoriphagus marinus]|uniref:helix-turn-helix domain-containing protein n=1 Tax=Algoriphagus marinus TaxID=1925762 RepID=UPI00094B97F6|nr:AraC family transcriptional regulator [Algoriphagus marinus]